MVTFQLVMPEDGQADFDLVTDRTRHPQQGRRRRDRREDAERTRTFDLLKLTTIHDEA